ncbi:MAG: hypothetical protein ACRERS_08285, partial [Methylococcales bacterium]
AMGNSGYTMRISDTACLALEAIDKLLKKRITGMSVSEIQENPVAMFPEAESISRIVAVPQAI